MESKSQVSFLLVILTSSAHEDSDEFARLNLFLFNSAKVFFVMIGFIPRFERLVVQTRATDPL